MPERNKIFISYSHNDKQWLDEFKTMFAPVKEQFDLVLWDDTKILAGGYWEQEIEQALEEAAVAILLVSKHFLASPFITTRELPKIFEAAHSGSQRVFWIPIGPCFWKQTPVRHFQAAHPPTKPLSTLLTECERDEALQAIVEKLLDVAKAPKRTDPTTSQQLGGDGLQDTLAAPLRQLFSSATGITHAYTARQEAAADMLRDIESATHSVELFARVYISELFYQSESLPGALLKAIAKREKATRAPCGPLLVRHVATDPRNEANVSELRRLEDPHLETPLWDTDEEYRAHLTKRSEKKFARCANKLQIMVNQSPDIAPQPPRELAVFKKHCFKNWITPYSLVAIDRKILYVGFYLLNRHGKRYGRESPSIRMTEGKWFEWFLNEICFIEEHYVKTTEADEMTWTTHSRS